MDDLYLYSLINDVCRMVTSGKDADFTTHCPEESLGASSVEAMTSTLEGDKREESQDNTMVGRAWYLHIESTVDRIRKTTEEAYHDIF